jgi:DNA mismatch repair protein MutS
MDKLLAEFEAMRAQNPGVLHLFKMGDFYEAFGDDAATLAHTIGLVLTERRGVRMAGLPYHQLHRYVRQLREAGQLVAVLEPIDGKYFATDV